MDDKLTKNINIAVDNYQGSLESDQQIRAKMISDSTNKQKEGTSQQSNFNPLKPDKFRGHIQAVFDANNFNLVINGNTINYDKQTLTQKGLQINLNDESSKQSSPSKLLIAGKNSIEYDRRYIENKYCLQLASAIDRGSNAAYQKMKNYKRNIYRNRETATPTPFYSLQICQLSMKKVPKKPRCFQTIFKKIPCHKIKILFENDSFFMQVIKFFCQINFKVDIDAIYLNQNNGNKQIMENFQQQSSFCNQKSESNLQELQSLNKIKKNNRKIILSSLTQFQKKAINVYEIMCYNLKFMKICYQRINLLIGTFNRENKLSIFLYQLNRQQICQQLTNYLPQIFTNSQNTQKSASQNKKFNGDISNFKFSEIQILNYILSIIKTIILSVNKSEIAFNIINTHLLTDENLILWLRINITKFIDNNQIRLKFIQFIAILSQFSTVFLTNFYINQSYQMNQIICKHVKWIYETLQLVHQNQDKQQKLKKVAYHSLDNLIMICRITIKQTISSVNIGRIICKQICQTATNLRAKDIQFLTFVCCVNPFSRHIVMRYLFSYFRKFIKSVKKSLSGPKNLIRILVRKNKHYVLQIMQSIRKISEIDSIDFAIQSQLLGDLETILKFFSHKHEKMQSISFSIWKGDCTISVYQAMLKNLKVQSSKQKDSITYDSDIQNQSK